MSALGANLPPEFGTYTGLNWKADGIKETPATLVLSENSAFTVSGIGAASPADTTWIGEGNILIDSSGTSTLVLSAELVGTRTTTTPTDTEFLVNNIAIVTGGVGGGAVALYDESGLVTADANELAFIGSSVSAILNGQRVEVSVDSSLSDYMGWASYVNPAYTQSVSADTRTAIDFGVLTSGPKNLKSAVDTHSFIQNSKFIPYGTATGGKYRVRLNLDVTATVVGTELTVELDIGGGIGVIDVSTRTLNKDAGEVQKIAMSFDFYTLGTFLANGGSFYVTAPNTVTLENATALVTVENI